MPYRYRFIKSDVSDEYKLEVLKRSSMEVFTHGKAYEVDGSLIVTNYKSKENSAGKIDDVYGFNRISSTSVNRMIHNEIAIDTLILDNDIEGLIAIGYGSYRHDINSHLKTSIVNQLTLVDNTINMYNHAC